MKLLKWVCPGCDSVMQASTRSTSLELECMTMACSVDVIRVVGLETAILAMLAKLGITVEGEQAPPNAVPPEKPAIPPCPSCKLEAQTSYWDGMYRVRCVNISCRQNKDGWHALQLWMNLHEQESARQAAKPADGVSNEQLPGLKKPEDMSSLELQARIALLGLSDDMASAMFNDGGADIAWWRRLRRSVVEEINRRDALREDSAASPAGSAVAELPVCPHCKSKPAVDGAARVRCSTMSTLKCEASWVRPFLWIAMAQKANSEKVS